jgi:hypothetical protein
MMPMSVYGWPSSVTARPMAAGSAPSWRRQNPCDATTTLIASSGLNVRPCRASTPSVAKKKPSARTRATRSAASAVVKFALDAE